MLLYSKRAAGIASYTEENGMKIWIVEEWVLDEGVRSVLYFQTEESARAEAARIKENLHPAERQWVGVDVYEQEVLP